ncbi:multicopper oxidase domain-containing protein [Nitrososphaera viennensis]|uniref:multicopper oxidase domain-containing protein n=1 Tax=Nitrososphaera viennensis TaxID=1034015 RepID=UPI0021B01EB4|nr:multicopper oxidase domain-containing protein [Nitrososphaera viennensis]
MSSSKLLLVVVIAVAVAGTAIAFSSLGFGADAQSTEKMVTGHSLTSYFTAGDVVDPEHDSAPLKNAVVDPDKYLREFNYGRVSKLPDGTTLREFTIVADDSKTLEVSPGVFFNAWTFNGTVPGPTIRATEGDLVRIHFINNGTRPHTMHFHGIHAAEMDGVFEKIAPGGQYTYEFTAEPFGLFLYHCHIQPLEEHISHGLYGVYIVDPKEPRPPADEMVMMMNGYDTDFDTENNFYTVNGIPFYYMHHPIQIEKDRLVRVYLVNILEFDQINNFHLHGNLFNLYRTGTGLTPDEYTDIVTMSQGERGILEFSYKYPGQYMFHAHKTEFAEKGWTGTFLVKEK